MNIKKFIYITLISITVLFSLGLLFKFNTNNFRKNEAMGASPDLKIATDPAFQEYIGSIVNGFPEDFPVYPGAFLVGSAKINPPNIPDVGYRVKWELETGISTFDVMTWYKRELLETGWMFEDPDDWNGIQEFIAPIERDNLKGDITVEIESDEIEIIVDLRKF